LGALQMNSSASQLSIHLLVSRSVNSIVFTFDRNGNGKLENSETTCIV
jgi:hypothetical protein